MQSVSNVAGVVYVGSQQKRVLMFAGTEDEAVVVVELVKEEGNEGDGLSFMLKGVHIS